MIVTMKPSKRIGVVINYTPAIKMEKTNDEKTSTKSDEISILYSIF